MGDTPRPLPSPQPPGYQGPELGEEPITASRMPAMLSDVRRVRAASLATNVVAVVVGIGAIVGVVRGVDARAAEKGAEAALDAGRKVDDLAARLDRHLAEESRDRAEVKEVMREYQADVRALYRSMQSGRPSPRLEKPLPKKDGGP